MYFSHVVALAAALILAGNVHAGTKSHMPHAEAEAAPAEAAPIVASANEAIVKVNGVVCSFCAHGLEKALSKLESLDATRHGNGVLVDIDSQLVTLALRPGEPVPFREIVKRIRKSGYDPVRFHVRVHGVASRGESGWTLRGERPPQVFGLTANPPGEATVEIALRVEVAALEALPESAPIPGAFDGSP